MMNNHEKHPKIAILVVLYDKEISLSPTIIEIIKQQPHNLSNLTIVNNGPNAIYYDEDIFRSLHGFCGDVVFREFLENRPLSKIYNSFIQNNIENDYFIIFDDDSLPADDFFDFANNTSVRNDLYLPKILSYEDNEFYYPTVHDAVIKKNGSLDVNGLMSISSGLIISKNLVDIMLSSYDSVFDERFALYGIDTSFFLRLRRIDKTLPGLIEVKCYSLVKHGLSRTSMRVNRFRVKERAFDMAITARHYSEYISFYTFLKAFMKSLLKLDFFISFALLFFYLKGKHPRC